MVEDTSSSIGLCSVETTQYIRQNHMEMCRFTGLNDPEYKKVSAALTRMASGPVIDTDATSDDGSDDSDPGKQCDSDSDVFDAEVIDREFQLSDKEKELIMGSLYFNQIHTHQMTIKKSHSETCRWLLTNPKYIEWLDSKKLSEHHGFLWIKGKAGAGKSTLMKYALSNVRTGTKELVVSFFFNARGHSLEKSTIGVYRSLLSQILDQSPALRDIFSSPTFKPLHLHLAGGNCPPWTVQTLKDSLEEVVRNLEPASLLCFIDALDECHDHEIRDMVSFFEHLGSIAASSGVPFRVCFASRHYPHITISKGLYLNLESQEGHKQDIGVS